MQSSDIHKSRQHFREEANIDSSSFMDSTLPKLCSLVSSYCMIALQQQQQQADVGNDANIENTTTNKPAI